jgi:hypothetical protein
MRIIGSTKYETKYGTNEENGYWKNLGRAGLAVKRGV